jgi:hypothetical protein
MPFSTGEARASQMGQNNNLTTSHHLVRALDRLVVPHHWMKAGTSLRLDATSPSAMQTTVKVTGSQETEQIKSGPLYGRLAPNKLMVWDGSLLLQKESSWPHVLW